jgi:hypothetical protein
MCYVQHVAVSGGGTRFESRGHCCRKKFIDLLSSVWTVATRPTNSTLHYMIVCTKL